MLEQKRQIVIYLENGPPTRVWLLRFDLAGRGIGILGSRAPRPPQPVIIHVILNEKYN